VLQPRPAPLDPNAARATITGISGLQGVLRSDVDKALGRSASRFGACYQDDLRAAGVAERGAGTVHIETDDSGTVTNATVTSPLTPAGARCLQHAVLGLHIANVDTGQAQADIAISFDLH
jgi:hypothetical protein